MAGWISKNYRWLQVQGQKLHSGQMSWEFSSHVVALLLLPIFFETGDDPTDCVEAGREFTWTVWWVSKWESNQNSSGKVVVLLSWEIRFKTCLKSFRNLCFWCEGILLPFFFSKTFQVKLSCGFGLVVWVFLITLYFDQRKNAKTLINLKNHQWNYLKRKTHTW